MSRQQTFYDILVSFNRDLGLVTTLALSALLAVIYVTERYLTPDRSR